MTLHPPPSSSPDPGPEHDPLIQRYLEASAQDPRRPSPALREAVLDAAKADAARRLGQSPAPANDRHWNWRAVASVAVIGFIGLLFLQFEKGTEAEREVLMGANPRSAATSAPAEAPAPASSPSPSLQAAPATPFAEADQAADAMAPAPPVEEQRRERAPERASALADKRKDNTLVLPKQSAPAPEARAPIQQPVPAAAEMAAPAPVAPSNPVPTPTLESEPLVLGKAAPPASDTASRSADTTGALAEKPAITMRRMPASPVARSMEEALTFVKQNDLPSLKQWLALGGQINARDNDGRTLLMWAAALGQEDVVEALLQAGADRVVEDRQGMTAADLAKQAGHEAIVLRLAR